MSLAPTADQHKPPPDPLPFDGVRTITIGMLLWLVALVALLPFWNDLEQDGHLWFIATAAVGTALGCIGIGYCWRRARHLGLR